MKQAPQATCPRTEQLSALIDEELAVAARNEITEHAASCPACGAMLEQLRCLREALRPLADARLDLDLAPLIDARLRVQPVHGKSPRTPARERGRRRRWRLLPAGFAAAGALVTGLYFGALLASGAAVTALQPASMALFDPVPPGGLCVGLRSCYPLKK